MRMSVIIIGILIMGFMVTGFYSVISEMGEDENYNKAIDDSYKVNFEKSEEVADDIQQRYEKIQNLSGNKGASIGIITLVPDVLILAKNMITLPFNIVGGMITSIIEYFNLPEWFKTFAITVITIFFIFGLIALILRYRYT